MSGRASGVPPFEDPRRVLARHGLKPKKRMSQNFLVARSVVERIAEASRAGDAGCIVELGPGLGTLTAELLRRGAPVLAIEKDRAMIEVLESELGAAEGFAVRHGDAASVDFGPIVRSAGRPITVVGNLPYAATGAILRNLISQSSVLAAAIIMVQKEVRNRLIAEPGTREYGALTVFTQAAFTVERIIDVKPGSFHPPPKVASAVVRLEPGRPARAAETQMFRRVVKAAFEMRRKTLRNALKRIALADLLDGALAKVSIDGSRRGETLSVEEFAALAAALEG